MLDGRCEVDQLPSSNALEVALPEETGEYRQPVGNGDHSCTQQGHQWFDYGT